MPTVYHPNTMIGNIDFGIDGSDGEESGPERAPLPLHLLAMIISYLDDPADLARVCRTSRVLHYMCLPTLYADVSLHSYDYIRYSEIDNRPEGSGGASPFSMGLNAIVTRNIAGYIKKFKVWGKWKEHDLEECAKVGRVPDSSMMLNLLVRAAVDRMPALETFSTGSWELDTKMLPNVWQGLAQRQTLSSVKVTFPKLRVPRLTTLVPPMQNLKSLHITDIDPLCYPDNISSLLLGSKKLEVLKLHWSPRMREAREPSVNLHSYFGKIMSANYKMPLKHIAAQNLYAFNEDVFEHIMDPNLIESYTMISSMGGADDGADIAFMDATWMRARPEATPNLKMLRGDKVSRIHCNMIGKFKNLERYYLITGRKPKDCYQDPSIRSNSAKGSNGICPGIMDSFTNSDSSGGSNSGTSISPASTPQSTISTTSSNSCPVQSSSTSFTSPSEPNALPQLARDYLEAIYKHHGASLRHLLLVPQWRLSSEDLARLVRHCPNLEQVGLGVEVAHFNMLRLLIPFLPKLYAIRILDNVDDSTLTDSISKVGIDCCEDKLGDDMWKTEFDTLRWVGLGDHVFEIASVRTVTEEGTVQTHKKVRSVPVGSVKDVEIWSMDRLEI
ncbi:hypothetical protein MMC11_004422 [Xylographa trunciseda]|nr:hypothetical protein [Xylographa trunciseda]